MGVIRLADANMVNALKLVSVRRGYDPREFTLVAFGGGGSMHAAALGRELRVKRIVVPTAPAVFSAWGMLMADLRNDYIRTMVVRTEQIEPAELTLTLSLRGRGDLHPRPFGERAGVRGGF